MNASSLRTQSKPRSVENPFLTLLTKLALIFAIVVRLRSSGAAHQVPTPMDRIFALQARLTSPATPFIVPLSIPAVRLNASNAPQPFGIIR